MSAYGTNTTVIVFINVKISFYYYFVFPSEFKVIFFKYVYILDKT